MRTTNVVNDVSFLTQFINQIIIERKIISRKECVKRADFDDMCSPITRYILSNFVRV